MKFCTNYGKELFDFDTKCVSCKCETLVSRQEYDAIKKELLSSNYKKINKRIQDDKYKFVHNRLGKNYWKNIKSLERSLYNWSYDHRSPVLPDNSKVGVVLHDREEERKKVKINIPECPTCGSEDILKISTSRRFVSTGLLGLASSDLGKTMRCKNCGYKW